MRKQLKQIICVSLMMLIVLIACQKETGLSSGTNKDATATTLNNATASKPAAITIVGNYDFSTFPNTKGTFVASGALNLSGSSTMDVGPNKNGMIAHCDVVLYPSNGSGTILISQECEFAITASFPYNRGSWQIVGGTGAYANLQGNGQLTMPPPSFESMTGFVYVQ